MATSCTHHVYPLRRQERDMLNIRLKLAKLQSNRLWPGITFPTVVDRIQKRFRASQALISRTYSPRISLPVQIYHKYQRKIDYGLVGAFVLGLSFAVLYITIGVLHINPTIAYAIQTVITVEMGFLLN
jgi:hypothetical protein